MCSKCNRLINRKKTIGDKQQNHCNHAVYNNIFFAHNFRLCQHNVQHLWRGETVTDYFEIKNILLTAQKTSMKRYQSSLSTSITNKVVRILDKFNNLTLTVKVKQGHERSSAYMYLIWWARTSSVVLAKPEDNNNIIVNYIQGHLRAQDPFSLVYSCSKVLYVQVWIKSTY